MLRDVLQKIERQIPPGAYRLLCIALIFLLPSLTCNLLQEKDSKQNDIAATVQALVDETLTAYAQTEGAIPFSSSTQTPPPVLSPQFNATQTLVLTSSSTSTLLSHTATQEPTSTDIFADLPDPHKDRRDSAGWIPGFDKNFLLMFVKNIDEALENGELTENQVPFIYQTLKNIGYNNVLAGHFVKENGRVMEDFGWTIGTPSLSDSANYIAEQVRDITGVSLQEAQDLVLKQMFSQIMDITDVSIDPNTGKIHIHRAKTAFSYVKDEDTEGAKCFTYTDELNDGVAIQEGNEIEASEKNDFIISLVVVRSEEEAFEYARPIKEAGFFPMIQQFVDSVSGETRYLVVALIDAQMATVDDPKLENDASFNELTGYSSEAVPENGPYTVLQICGVSIIKIPTGTKEVPGERPKDTPTPTAMFVVTPMPTETESEVPTGTPTLVVTVTPSATPQPPAITPTLPLEATVTQLPTNDPTVEITITPPTGTVPPTMDSGGGDGTPVNTPGGSPPPPPFEQTLTPEASLLGDEWNADELISGTKISYKNLMNILIQKFGVNPNLEFRFEFAK